jgi:hypothetical protein
MNPYILGEPLSVRLGSAIFPGNDAGKAFRIKRAEDGDVLEKQRANVWQGTLLHWRRIGVIASTKDKARFFIIEPADTPEEILFEDFYVRGKFKVVEKVNHTQDARDAWRAFKPE